MEDSRVLGNQMRQRGHHPALQADSCLPQPYCLAGIPIAPEVKLHATGFVWRLWQAAAISLSSGANWVLNRANKLSPGDAFQPDKCAKKVTRRHASKNASKPVKTSGPATAATFYFRGIFTAFYGRPVIWGNAGNSAGDPPTVPVSNGGQI